MGCAGLLTPELDCPSTWLDRGLVTDSFAALTPAALDIAREWDESLLDPRGSLGTGLLEWIASLLGRRSRAN